MILMSTIQEKNILIDLMIYLMKYLFDSIIVDMLSNEKLEPAVTKLFICDRKLNISLVFVSESYFAAPKNF